MAQNTGNRQGRDRPRRKPRPLDAAKLEELALAYVARFATSTGKLERYLKRKLYERGWEGREDGADPPDVDALVERYAERGYVDDAAYARMRSADLLRRGYGGRRVSQALGEAGVGEAARGAVAPSDHAAREAALRLAEKRRFGPFAAAPVEREKREKQIAAMLRAGHTFDHARAVLDAASPDAVRAWVAEAEERDDNGFA